MGRDGEDRASRWQRHGTLRGLKDQRQTMSEEEARNAPGLGRSSAIRLVIQRVSRQPLRFCACSDLRRSHAHVPLTCWLRAAHMPIACRSHVGLIPATCHRTPPCRMPVARCAHAVAQRPLSCRTRAADMRACAPLRLPLACACRLRAANAPPGPLSSAARSTNRNEPCRRGCKDARCLGVAHRSTGAAGLVSCPGDSQHGRGPISEFAP